MNRTGFGVGYEIVGVSSAHGLALPRPRPREPAPAWGAWLDWEPNKIWCWDLTHFPTARRVAFAIVCVVGRRWIATHLSTEETSTQVRVLFGDAPGAEGLTEHITPERVEDFAADATRPILLAASDNGPQMTSPATREFFAALAVVQRLGRPGAPTDQALDREPLRPPQDRIEHPPVSWRHRLRTCAGRWLGGVPAVAPVDEFGADQQGDGEGELGESVLGAPVGVAAESAEVR